MLKSDVYITVRPALPTLFKLTYRNSCNFEHSVKAAVENEDVSLFGIYKKKVIKYTVDQCFLTVSQIHHVPICSPCSCYGIQVEEKLCMLP